jgi:hypothetical protein
MLLNDKTEALRVTFLFSTLQNTGVAAINIYQQMASLCHLTPITSPFYKIGQELSIPEQNKPSNNFQHEKKTKLFK